MIEIPTVHADPASGGRRIVVCPPAPEPIGLTLRPAHPAYDRVDRVEWHPRSGQIRLVTGTPGAPPPRASDGWESVALVRVPRASMVVTAAQIVPVAPGGTSPGLQSGVYRTGRRNGRNLYAQVGPDPTDGDVSIGMLDTPDLARFAVDAMNAALAGVPPVAEERRRRDDGAGPGPRRQGVDGGG